MARTCTNSTVHNLITNQLDLFMFSHFKFDYPLIALCKNLKPNYHIIYFGVNAKVNQYFNLCTGWRKNYVLLRATCCNLCC